MDVSLLKDRFKAIKQETVDVAVSSINAYRAFIGNGVAVGKLAEPIFAKLLDAPDEGFFAFHFAFTGKNPPFDVMLYKAEKEIPKTRFGEVRKLYSSDFEKFHDAISEIVGGNNWCGISLKNYLNEEAQVSTNYDIRTLCEEYLGNDEKTHNDPEVINGVLKKVGELLSHETIVCLNSFPKTSEYQFAIFESDKVKDISEIEFKKLRKHARYNFRQNGSPVFHAKYGKNQNNPFQRGLWMDDLSKLTVLLKGKLRETSYGEYVLEGAFRIHPPV
jgi:hypothetical protein